MRHDIQLFGTPLQITELLKRQLDRGHGRRPHCAEEEFARAAARTAPPRSPREPLTSPEMQKIRQTLLNKIFPPSETTPASWRCRPWARHAAWSRSSGRGWEATRCGGLWSGSPCRRRPSTSAEESSRAVGSPVQC